MMLSTVLFWMLVIVSPKPGVDIDVNPVSVEVVFECDLLLLLEREDVVTFPFCDGEAGL